MLDWAEGHINSSYFSFVLHMLMGASRLKNTSGVPFLLNVLLGTWLGLYVAGIVALSRWPAILVGSPAGFITVSATFWLAALGYIRLLFPFPDCAQGKCRKMSDYKWSIGTIYGWEAWGIHRYWCSCSDEYVRLGCRFFRLREKEDGYVEFVPYKKLVGFRRWADDEDEPPEL